MTDAGDERRKALRALLSNPCLVSGRDDDDLSLIRRHRVPLREWIQRHTGWHLHIEPGFARLQKRPGHHGLGRGARDARTGQPFTRRRYVLACLALAALERAERQTTLGRIADDLLALAHSDSEIVAAGVDFTLECHADRRDLVAVVRWLLEVHAIVRIDGQEDDYLSGRGDVLYRVEHSLLAWLPQWLTPPSLIEEEGAEQRLEALTEAGHLESSEARREARRHRLARRLLDDPVLYFDELSDEDVEYLNRTRGSVVRDLAETTGLEVEQRAEGIALVDRHGELTDAKLPEEGTEGHITLLVAEFLADHLRQDAPETVESRAVREHLVTMRAVHGRYWRKAAREPGSEESLAEAALRRLAELCLIRVDDEGAIRPLPAVARYALMAPQIMGEITGENADGPCA